VAANCSTIPSRRTRDSCASRRAFSIASRAAIDARLGIQAFLVERAQRVVGFFERATLGRQFGFDFQPPREEVFQLSFEFHDRKITIGQRRFELGAANLRLRTLIGHAL
jgi:hypothetical protein